MELGFLLSVIGLLGGIWIYLYRTILDITVSAPADSTLLFLGFMHFTVLTYLVLALYVFYRRGLENTAPTGRAAVANAIILQTWPMVVICLLLSFLLARVSHSKFGMGSYMWIMPAAALIAAAYQTLRTTGILTAKHVATIFMCIAIFGMPYIFVMSFFLADVQITTDKELYIDKDSVLVSVRAAGYIFRPQISKMSFGAYEGSGDVGDRTILVAPEQHRGQDFISVEYVPQMISIKREAFHTMKIAKSHQQTK